MKKELAASQQQNCLWVLCDPLRANQSSPQASIQHDIEEILAKHQKKPARIVHLHIFDALEGSLCVLISLEPPQRR